MPFFQKSDFDILKSIGHVDGMPGYRAAKTHNDTTNVIKLVYSINTLILDRYKNSPLYKLSDYLTLHRYFKDSYDYAVQIASFLNLPAECMPHIDYCVLKVLYRPLGGGLVSHVDGTLLAINLYSSSPLPVTIENRPAGIIASYPDTYIGEKYTESGLGAATAHSIPTEATARESLVFNVEPDPDVWIPYAMGQMTPEQIADNPILIKTINRGNNYGKKLGRTEIPLSRIESLPGASTPEDVLNRLK
jgi:hypothetical protein